MNDEHTCTQNKNNATFLSTAFTGFCILLKLVIIKLIKIGICSFAFMD